LRPSSGSAPRRLWPQAIHSYSPPQRRSFSSPPVNRSAPLFDAFSSLMSGENFPVILRRELGIKLLNLQRNNVRTRA
jgi:hypothetical protein